MSIHSSLRQGSGSGAKHRNVLTRLERMQKLSTDGRWSEDKTMFGLPKVRSIKVAVKKKKKDPAAAAGEEKKA